MQCYGQAIFNFMAKATIRFNSEKAAKGFAERTGGTFKECHSKESSAYKVRVSGVEKHSSRHIEQPSQKPDGANGSEWDDYAWGGNDY